MPNYSDLLGFLNRNFYLINFFLKNFSVTAQIYRNINSLKFVICLMNNNIF